MTPRTRLLAIDPGSVRLGLAISDTDDDERVVALRPVGRPWISRLRVLDEATARWSP